MTTDDLIKYYKDLLIAQYNDRPNARAVVGVFAQEAITDQVIAACRDAYSDIDTALGVQLDIIGKYVGVPRRVNGLDISREFFAMPSYDDASPGDYHGFADYDETAPDWYFRVYRDENSAYSMTDAEMRLAIKMKIRQNCSNHSLEDIDDITDEFFGADCLVTDGADMTLTYAFTPGLTYNLPAIAAFMKILPHPAGIKITVTGL